MNLQGKPFYRESAPQLWSFVGDTKPQFHGYRLQKDGSPEFAYSIGNIEIRERISNGAEAGSFVRHFTLSQAKDELRLNLAQDSSARIVSDKGELKDQTLTLTGDDTKSFTLTISKP